MKNKGNQFFRLLILPLVCAMILSLFPNLSVNAKDDDFKVEVKVGFGNTAVSSFRCISRLKIIRKTSKVLFR